LGTVIGGGLNSCGSKTSLVILLGASIFLWWRQHNARQQNTVLRAEVVKLARSPADSEAISQPRRWLLIADATPEDRPSHPVRIPETVRLGPHRLLLRPREGHELHIESSLLETSPVATVHWLRDIYDNSVAIANFALPATQLMIDSEVVVQHFDEAPLDFVVADEAVNYPFRYDPDSAAVLRPYLVDVQAPVEQQALRSWLSQRWQVGEQVQTYGLLQRMCVDIKDTLEYQAREYPGVQTAAETLARVPAHAATLPACSCSHPRCLGLAARFVSGYLDTAAYRQRRHPANAGRS
jgi:transglutaminase-like putative cysteine protease